MSLLRAVGFCAIAALATTPLAAQSLQDRLENGLFHFGDCDQPLCLNSSVSTQSGHGDHYIGSKLSGTQNLLDFLSGAIAVGVSDVPISTATSGITFKVVGGVPVPTSSSGGPIFGERVQTVGRGRFLVGVNVTGVHFSSVRGVPLSNIALVFTHENIGNPALGNPTFENDVIEVNTSIDLNLQVAALNLTYGLSNRIDFGVTVPLVRADLSGGSIARIVPFATPTPHFFGNSSNQLLSAGSEMSGTATGIGDASEHVRQTKVFLERGLRAMHPLYIPKVMPNADSLRSRGIAGEFAFAGATISTEISVSPSGSTILRDDRS